MSESKKMTPEIAEDLTAQEIENKKSLDFLMETIGQLGGSKSKQFGEMILNQLRNACHSYKEPEDMLKCVIEDIRAISPQGPIEGMLATQMIATHYATMECFGRATKLASCPLLYQENLNIANKLTRSFATQMEALNRHRGKGQQKVTVEHVHVHSGGQAIVGNVASTKHPK